MVVIKVIKEKEEAYLRQMGDSWEKVEHKSEATQFENFLVALCVVKDFDMAGYDIKIEEL